MTEGTQQRVGFSAIEGREAKAEKILAILSAAGRPLSAKQRVLDIGTGNGQIAAALSLHCELVAVDVVDQRTHGRGLPFITAARDLPFPDASFDLVISNHVIEHTGDPAQHLHEIRRVLRPNGVAYLATPNRWWPWEVHTRLPLLHYLPWPLFSRIGQVLGKLHEPVQLQSLRSLAWMTSASFHLAHWHPRVLKDPRRYALKLPTWATYIARFLPDRLLAATAGLQPTLITLLYPK